MIITTSERQRFEIKAGENRAFYGHSVNQKIKKESKTPPKYLYQEATEEAYKIIKETGIKPMQRQYVRLAKDTITAPKIAERYTKKPLILRIDTESAIKKGVEFYFGNNNIWLATTIPFDNVCQRLDY